MMENSLPKLCRYIGHFSFLAFLACSIWWMYARVCNMDPAYQVFEMLNTENFAISDGRYSMVVSQLLPWFAIRCHASLHTVMLIYSLSFGIMAYLLYLLTLYVLKADKVAFCMVMVFLCMRHTFMHAISETFQLMFFAMFCYALLSHKRERGTPAAGLLYYAVLFFSLAFCLFIHPVSVFFLAFIWLYTWISENFKWRRELVCSLVFLVVCYLVKPLLPKDGAHDDTFLIPISDLLRLLPDILHFGSLKFFIQHFFDFYYLPVLLFVWTCICYLKRKEGVKAAFYVLFNFIFFFITIWIYHAGDGPIGMERSFLPMLFFTGIPFVKEVLPMCNVIFRKGFVCVISLLLVVSMVRMAAKAESRQRAFRRMEMVLQEARRQNVFKIWVSEEDAKALQIPTDWSAGISSILYSTCKFGKENTMNLYVYSPDVDLTGDELLVKRSFAFVPWWIYRDSGDMNARYFALKEGPYCLMERNKDSLIFKPFAP